MTPVARFLLAQNKFAVLRRAQQFEFEFQTNATLHWSRHPAVRRDTAPTDEALTQMLALDAAGRLRAALVAVVGGRGRGFTDPPPGRLLAFEVERVLRITGQALTLGLVDAGRAASWIAAPSSAQRHWLRDALGWSAGPAPTRPPAPPALTLVAAAVAALVVMWSGVGARRRRGAATGGDSGGGGGGGGGTATAGAALLAAGTVLFVAGAAALSRRT